MVRVAGDWGWWNRWKWFYWYSPGRDGGVQSQSPNTTRESMPYNRIGKNWCKFSRPECATSQRDVTLDCGLIHWLMALDGWRGGAAEGEVCILRSPGIAASPISLLSMGGVCGRSLTPGKILFTGRQTCSLYLVLWLCGAEWWCGTVAEVVMGVGVMTDVRDGEWW